MWVVVLIMGWSLPLAVGIRVGIGGSAWFLIAILVLWAFIGLLVCWGGRWILSGLGDASLFRDALAALLQRKMFPDEPGRIVRMKDFGVTRPSLKIVSDNLNRRRLQLFSPERTPEEVTADAVAASIRLPLIFRPWRIDGELHVDGGIVSNLPAWPFDEERELDPEALTITVEAADSTDKAGARAVNWLPAAIRTALFGADELNLRLSGVAERLVLETKLDVLQFDLSLPQVREEVRDAWRAASLRLDTQLFRVPELYRDACRVIQDTTVEVLRGVLNGNPGKVRVAVGVRDQDFHHSVRLRYSVGFENDHDEAILCPVSGSVIGMAWLTGETQFEVAPLPDRFQFPGLSNRLRRVVQIDGDASIPKAGTAIGNAVAAIENAVIRLFQQIRDQLA
jgi:NTE family protein